MGLHLLEDELHGGVSEDGLDLWVVEGCLSSSFRVVLSHTPLQTSPGILWWQEEREREREGDRDDEGGVGGGVGDKGGLGKSGD